MRRWVVDLVPFAALAVIIAMLVFIGWLVTTHGNP